MWESIKARLAGGASDQLSGLRFEFGVPVPAAPAVIAIVVLAVIAAVFWWRRLSNVRGAARPALVAFRAIALLIALFLALDPCIVGQLPVPNEDYVVILMDNSKSMQVKGADDLSRGDRVRNAYAEARPTFESKLKQRHQLAYYSVGAGIDRLPSLDTLRFDAPESNLTGAIEAVVADLEGVTVSAVVLVSDGIQQPGATTAALDDLPEGVPVFTVAADTERDWSDLLIERFSATRTEFDKSPVVVTATILADNLAGETAIVEVLDGNRVVKTETLVIENDRDELEARIEFIPNKKAWIEYVVRARLKDPDPADPATPEASAPQIARDPIDQNNEARFVIDNREVEHRILYFTGRPNWEGKFFRRAMSEDDTLSIMNLIRISKAETKFEYKGDRTEMSNPLFEGFVHDKESQPRYDESVFIRLGTKATELADGYPTKPEDLFPFDLVVLGDVEHDFFSLKHLELTRDFVERRGGALLLLGGPHSFAEGQYGGSALERMMPFVLRGTIDSDAAAAEAFSVKPTPDGLFSGVLAIDANPEANTAKWNLMPVLHGLNRFALVRPGATILANADTGTGEDVPWLAVQRYGEGKCAALATGETWQWQMQNDLNDSTYESLWRQTVRYLVKDVPDQVMLRAKDDNYEVDREMALEVLVRDREYDPAEGLRVTANVRPPSGKEMSVPVDESIQESGVYSVKYEPEAIGMHLITVSALDDRDETVGTMDEAFLVAPDNREFHNPKLDREFLASISDRSGGYTYETDDFASIADDIPWEPSKHAERVRIHLWHIPAFFAVLAILFGAEWYLRRRKGQP
jgi:uncharacterized membrane protein